MIELSKRTNFPWLLSNVVHTSPHFDPNDGTGGKLLALAKQYVVKSMGGYKIGFFGLAGTYVHSFSCICSPKNEISGFILNLIKNGNRDWPSNCQHLPPARFLSPVDISRHLAKYLRTVQNCDFVIAITHMRLTEDLAVSKATEHGDDRVDLLLGGHDHNVICRFTDDTDENPEVILQGLTNSEYVSTEGKTIKVEGDVRIVKSGTDWRSYSVAELVVKRKEDGGASLKTVKRMIYLITHPPDGGARDHTRWANVATT